MLAYRIKTLERWIAYRTYDRYNVVKTELRPGYYEKDEILLYSSFAILRRFVEIELTVDGLDNLINDTYSDEYYDYEKSRRIHREIRALYHWWTEERPARNDPGNDWKREQKYYEEDTQMLRRLVTIRPWLWT